MNTNTEATQMQTMSGTRLIDGSDRGGLGPACPTASVVERGGPPRRRAERVCEMMFDATGTRRCLKRGQGFTLPELLVLVAMGAVLTGLLLPDLSETRAKLLQQACAANMKQWGTVFLMYADDYGGAIVVNHSVPPHPSSYWYRSDGGYARYWGIPGDVTAGVTGARIKNAKMCPAMTNWNTAADSTLPGYTMYRPNNPRANFTGFNLKHVSYPGNFIVMSDAVPGSSLAFIGANGNGPTDVYNGCRHFGGANVMFGDFHIEWKVKSDIEHNLAVWMELNGIVGDIPVGNCPWFP